MNAIWKWMMTALLIAACLLAEACTSLDRSSEGGERPGIIIDPPQHLSRLVGRAAPEFQKIKAWKNSRPLRLAKLRGRYVLLDFWGYWCGPCVRDIPALMAIAEAFPEDKLIVVGIHDDSVGSVEEMDEKLSRARERIWMGRDIPYPVAIDGGGDTTIEGTDVSARGATTAAYGITSFPTAVLIGPDGKVLGRFHAPGLDQKIAGLERLLGTRAKRPEWRKRFDKVYRLEHGEPLRHVPRRYIRERQDFFFRQFTRWGWFHAPMRNMPRAPESATLIWNDQKKQAQGGMHSGHKRLTDLLRDLGFEEREFVDSSRLLERRIPGDWIKRESAEREDLLEAFQKILNDDLKLPVRFVPDEVERDTFIARGSLKLRPLGPEYSEYDVQLYVESPDPPDNVGGGGGGGDLNRFLSYVGRLGRVRIVNRADAAQLGKITWRQHSSARSPRLRADPALFRRLLENVAKQTSLQFGEERQRERVWLVESAE